MGSMTINEWCAHRRVSRSSFYNLKRQGRAPAIIDSGGPRITTEVDQRWQKAREREAAKAGKECAA